VGSVTDDTMVEWDELPAAVRAAVEAQAGAVLSAEPHGEGRNSPLRLVLETVAGQLFVKGVGPGELERRRWKLDLGTRLAPYVTRIAPALLWRVEAEGWDIAGYEYLPGRPWADQNPGSPDVPKIVSVLRELEGIPAPGLLDVTAVECWGRYADDPSVLEGSSFVHRDPGPANFVADDERAWMVDWGWAVRGPAWLTSAQLVLSLMEHEWEAGAAEEAVSELPAWQAAAPRALADYAAINARMWDGYMVGNSHPVDGYRAGVARAWAQHRAELAEAVQVTGRARGSGHRGTSRP
jgi:hypothetical protein